MSVVDVKNVSICYVTGDFKNIGLKEFVMRKLTGHYEVRQFWADRDVSFSLKKGDMLGILGINGAGKSALLKAVTGIMAPTEGSVITHGKIAALLELESNLDPDLTVKSGRLPFILQRNGATTNRSGFHWSSWRPMPPQKTKKGRRHLISQKG